MVLKLRPFSLIKLQTDNQRLDFCGISANRNIANIIQNSEFKGLDLRVLYKSEKELFGNYPYDEFPVILKSTYIEEVIKITFYDNLNSQRFIKTIFGKGNDISFESDGRRVLFENLFSVYRGNLIEYKINENNSYNRVTAHLYGDYITVLEGNGFIDNFRVGKGDFFMVTSNSQYSLEGKIKYHIFTLSI